MAPQLVVTWEGTGGGGGRRRWRRCGRGWHRGDRWCWWYRRRGGRRNGRVGADWRTGRNVGYGRFFCER